MTLKEFKKEMKRKRSFTMVGLLETFFAGVAFGVLLKILVFL